MNALTRGLCLCYSLLFFGVFIYGLRQDYTLNNPPIMRINIFIKKQMEKRNKSKKNKKR